MDVKTLKGFRDFLPIQARKRQYVIDILKEVFENFGFEPLETPTLEFEEILTNKYGQEADLLMYRFKDNGGRSVVMRYDQTVPLARVIAQFQNDIPLPFKRYQIQPVWRAENTQKGRFREFLQADIDIAGSSSSLSDAEIIQVALKGFESLGFKNVEVLINDRSSFDLLDQAAITAIDKLKKIGAEEVKKELRSKGLDPDILGKIRKKEPSENIKKIIKLLTEFGIKEEKIKFEPTLARGLSYYTGAIFEVESEDYSGGSLGGGGRYDNLIGTFAGRQVPAVGFSFGFDRTIEAMEELSLLPDQAISQALITAVSETLPKSIEITNFLRDKGLSVDLFPDELTPLDKQMRYADKKGYPFVVIPKGETFTLKNMKDGTAYDLYRENLFKEIAEKTP